MVAPGRGARPHCTEAGPISQEARRRGKPPVLPRELSSWALSRWGRQGGPVKRGRPARQVLGTSEAAFRAVAVKRAEVAAGGLVVQGRGGVRVEGLSVTQVVQVLRELGG